MSQPFAWWLLKPLEQDNSDLSNAALAEMYVFSPGHSVARNQPSC